jgi:hypothetical protein
MTKLWNMPCQKNLDKSAIVRQTNIPKNEIVMKTDGRPIYLPGEGGGVVTKRWSQGRWGGARADRNFADTVSCGRLNAGDSTVR